MVDFSDCETERELEDRLKEEAEALAARHKSGSPYDEPQFVLRDPHDEQRAEQEENEFDEVVQAAVDRAEQILDADTLRDRRPLWEDYGHTVGDYYGDAW